MNKKNRQVVESKRKPIIVTNYIKYEDLRCMGQQILINPKIDLKIQNQMIELLNDTYKLGIDNFDRNEFWLYDVITGEFNSGIEPNHIKSCVELTRNDGGRIFMLTRREDDRFHNSVSGLIGVWKVDELPTILDKVFQTIPPGFDGVEYGFGKELSNGLTPVKFWKINYQGETK